MSLSNLWECYRSEVGPKCPEGRPKEGMHSVATSVPFLPSFPAPSPSPRERKAVVGNTPTGSSCTPFPKQISSPAKEGGGVSTWSQFRVGILECN